MAELAAITKDLDFHLEQVQDFTPTPMTLATEIYYTGYHPYTGEKVFTAKSQQEKLAQRQFFFWYKPESRQQIITELRRLNRPDILERLYPGQRGNSQDRSKSTGPSRDKRNNSDFKRGNKRDKRGRF